LLLRSSLLRWEPPTEKLTWIPIITSLTTTSSSSLGTYYSADFFLVASCSSILHLLFRQESVNMFCDLASVVLQARYVGSSGSFVDDDRAKQIRVRRKPQSMWFSRPCMRIVVLNVGICRSGSEENQEAGCISTIPAARGARDLQSWREFRLIMHHPSTSWRSRLSSQGYSKDSLEITVSRGGAAPGVLIMLRLILITSCVPEIE
jgi:hypothetical protein